MVLRNFCPTRCGALGLGPPRKQPQLSQPMPTGLASRRPGAAMPSTQARIRPIERSTDVQIANGVFATRRGPSCRPVVNAGASTTTP